MNTADGDPATSAGVKSSPPLGRQKEWTGKKLDEIADSVYLGGRTSGRRHSEILADIEASRGIILEPIEREKVLRKSGGRKSHERRSKAHPAQQNKGSAAPSSTSSPPPTTTKTDEDPKPEPIGEEIVAVKKYPTMVGLEGITPQVTTTLRQRFIEKLVVDFDVMVSKIIMDDFRRSLFQVWKEKHDYEGDLGDFLIDCFDWFMKERRVRLKYSEESPILYGDGQ